MEKSKVFKMEDSWVYWKGVKLAARFVLGVIINQLIVVKFYNKENTRLGFCAFTVTPLKMKMRTSRCRKPRIREMKEDEYSKSFAKHQVCTIIYRLCMKTPCWCLFELLWGAQIWPPQTNLAEIWPNLPSDSYSKKPCLYFFVFLLLFLKQLC